MNRRTVLALDIARYGLYLLLFASVAIGRTALPPDRLALLAGLLLVLTLLGYICTERARSTPVRTALLIAELAIIVTIGFNVRTGWFPVLYFVFVAEVFFSLPRQLAVGVALAAYGTLAVTLGLVARPARIDDLVINLLIWLSGFIFIGTSSLLTIEHRDARAQSESLLKELQTAHAQLQAYAGEVERLSVTRERQRIAQEVHDSVAHVLTALLVQIQALRRLLPHDPTTAAARLGSMEDAARRGLEEVRRAVRAMRPKPLEKTGGVDALRALCDDFADRTEIRVFYTTEGTLKSLSPSLEAQIYRALQECLTNAAQHGRASAVWAHLRVDTSRAELRVRDDGVGTAQVTIGMGISGIQERAHAAGGEFVYHSRAGKGFEATLHLPLVAPADAEAITPR